MLVPYESPEYPLEFPDVKTFRGPAGGVPGTSCAGWVVLLVSLKKTDYNTKITEIEKKLTDHNHEKHITTLEFNTLAVSVFNARLSQANLITQTDFDAKLPSLSRKITSNKSKH